MRVLIVDDLKFVRDTLRKIFTAAGHTVVAEAENGVDAVQLFSDHNPDVVTMDLVMPKMSGIEAVRRIIKNHPDARILVLSAMTQESLVMEAVHAGARGFMAKPFRSDELLRAIETLPSNDVGTEPQTVAG